MRILILDDDDSRHKVFRRNLIGHEKVVHAYTYEAACRALQEERFDAVYIDHDLSSEAAAGVPAYGEKTGEDFAKFLTSLPEEQHPEYAVVHSFNFTGAQRIQAELRNSRCKVIRELFGVRSGANWK